MKKLLSFVMCIIILCLLCACNSSNNKKETQSETVAGTIETDSPLPEDAPEYDSTLIVGTWICEDINKDCYFIFDEKGDAYAKWGTTTVYGYYDYYSDENIYDIDVPNFLFNEYTATFKDDTMVLSSDETKYTFKKATMPKVIIKAPDNLKVDSAIIGNWQSADSYECYEFRNDNTAVITDMYNYATVDCKYGCNNGVVTIYSMATDKKDHVTELNYKLKEGKLELGDYTYEPVQVNN